MMSLPFFGLFLSLVLAAKGQRGVALLAWFASIAGLVVLFRLHATDSLNVVF